MNEDIIKGLTVYLRVEDNTRFTDGENSVLESIIEFIKKIDLKINIVIINNITKEGCRMDVGFVDCDFILHIGYDFANGHISYCRSDVMEGVYINEGDKAIKQITEYINKWCKIKKL